MIAHAGNANIQLLPGKPEGRINVYYICGNSGVLQIAELHGGPGARPCGRYS